MIDLNGSESSCDIPLRLRLTIVERSATVDCRTAGRHCGGGGGGGCGFGVGRLLGGWRGHLLVVWLSLDGAHPRVDLTGQSREHDAAAVWLCCVPSVRYVRYVLCGRYAARGHLWLLAAADYLLTCSAYEPCRFRCVWLHSNGDGCTLGMWSASERARIECAACVEERGERWKNVAVTSVLFGR